MTPPRLVRSLLATLACVAALAACSSSKSSSSSTTAKSTATTTASSATTSAPQSGSPISTGNLDGVFAPISGYQLTELPSAVLDEARKQYENEVSSNEIAKQAVSRIDGRSVGKDGQPVAIILALSFDEKVAALPGFVDEFLKGAAGEENAKQVSVAGQTATSFEQSDGTKGIVFAKGRLGLLVIGAGTSGGDDLTDIMTKLVANNI